MTRIATPSAVDSRSCLDFVTLIAGSSLSPTFPIWASPIGRILRLPHLCLSGRAPGASGHHGRHQERMRLPVDAPPAGNLTQIIDGGRSRETVPRPAPVDPEVVQIRHDLIRPD